MTHSIKYGDKTIEFSLLEKESKSLRIIVNPDLSIFVYVPLDKDLSEIYQKVRKRAKWINNQLQYFKLLPSLPREKKYASGETYKYLGKQYRLKINVSEKEEVKLKGQYIFINTKDSTNKKKIKSLLDKWYFEKAEKRFEVYKNECLKKMSNYIDKNPEIKIRKLNTKWGNCNRNGEITLNIDLIKHSPLSIGYVIFHELCHLKYFNHGKDFYNLLAKVLPDWKERKMKLEHSEL